MPSEDRWTSTTRTENPLFGLNALSRGTSGSLASPSEALGRLTYFLRSPTKKIFHVRNFTRHTIDFLLDPSEWLGRTTYFLHEPADVLERLAEKTFDTENFIRRASKFLPGTEDVLLGSDRIVLRHQNFFGSPPGENLRSN